MYRTIKYNYSGTTRSFISLWIYIYEMGPPMSEIRVKESQSRAASPLFAQVGVGA